MMLVCLLGQASHLGLDVPQQEVSDSRDQADHLCYPESHFPAVVLGDGAEG